MVDRTDGSKNIDEDPRADEVERSKVYARQIVEEKLPLGMRGDIELRVDQFRVDFMRDRDRLLMKAMVNGEVEESIARVLGGVTLDLCGLVIQEAIAKAKLELRLYAAPNSFDGKRVRIKIGQLRENAQIVAQAARQKAS